MRLLFALITLLLPISAAAQSAGGVLRDGDITAFGEVAISFQGRSFENRSFEDKSPEDKLREDLNIIAFGEVADAIAAERESRTLKNFWLGGEKLEDTTSGFDSMTASADTSLLGAAINTTVLGNYAWLRAAGASVFPRSAEEFLGIEPREEGIDITIDYMRNIGMDTVRQAWIVENGHTPYVRNIQEAAALVARYEQVEEDQRIMREQGGMLPIILGRAVSPENLVLIILIGVGANAVRGARTTANAVRALHSSQGRRRPSSGSSGPRLRRSSRPTTRSMLL